MTKKLGIASGIINFAVSAMLITAATLFAVLTVRLAVDCKNSGLAVGLIIGVPFCVFVTAILAVGSAALAVFAVKSLFAIKKDDEKKQKNIAAASVVISAALTIACALFFILTLAVAVFGNGGNYNALMYEAIPLVAVTGNLIINKTIMKDFKRKEIAEGNR